MERLEDKKSGTRMAALKRQGTWAEPLPGTDARKGLESGMCPREGKANSGWGGTSQAAPPSLPNQGTNGSVKQLKGAGLSWASHWF